MSEPVFVLGRHRSGTTWLTNLLADHPQVYTPQHSVHEGQHESAYYSHLVPYCRWGKTEMDQRAIQAIFERSDYWHLLFPGEPSPEFDIQKLGVDAYFDQTMTEAASRRGASYWLEKTPAHTALLPYLMKAFPDATFVAVEREPMDVIRSNVHKFANPSSHRDWFKAAVVTALYRKFLSAYRDSVCYIRYEQLVEYPAETLIYVCQHIGVEPLEYGGSRWARNSSYTGEAPQIPAQMRASAKAGLSMANCIPTSVCVRLISWYALNRRPNSLPVWFFRVCQGGRSTGSD